MKKLFILLLISVMLLTGCNAGNTDSGASIPKADSKVQKITVYSNSIFKDWSAGGQIDTAELNEWEQYMTQRYGVNVQINTESYNRYDLDSFSKLIKTEKAEGFITYCRPCSAGRW